jgi:hypothetical protein
MQRWLSAGDNATSDDNANITQRSRRCGSRERPAFWERPGGSDLKWPLCGRPRQLGNTKGISYSRFDSCPLPPSLATSHSPLTTSSFSSPRATGEARRSPWPRPGHDVQAAACFFASTVFRKEFRWKSSLKCGNF